MARLHRAGELGVERRNRKCDADGAVRGKLLEQIDVPRHQRVLRNDPDRLPALGRHGHAATRDLELPLAGLVAIGDAGKGDQLRPPRGASEKIAEQLGRPIFDEHLCFEIEPGRQAQVLVVGSGVAIAATVGTAAVGIYAKAEAHVRAVVFGHNRLRLVGKILGGGPAELGQILVVIGNLLQVSLQLNCKIAVGRLNRGATTFER